LLLALAGTLAVAGLGSRVAVTRLLRGLEP
jgi:hypothetical protein